MFKLNQIQMDIRRKLEEETKDDIVHKKEDSIVKNNKSNKPFVDEIEVEESKNKKRRYLTIDGEKNKDNNLEVSGVRSKQTVGEKASGLFIDKIK